MRAKAFLATLPFTPTGRLPVPTKNMEPTPNSPGLPHLTTHAVPNGKTILARPVPLPTITEAKNTHSAAATEKEPHTSRSALGPPDKSSITPLSARRCNTPTIQSRISHSAQPCGHAPKAPRLEQKRRQYMPQSSHQTHGSSPRPIPILGRAYSKHHGPRVTFHKISFENCKPN